MTLSKNISKYALRWWIIPGRQYFPNITGQLCTCAHTMHKTCANLSHTKSTPAWKKSGQEVPAQEEELLVFENFKEKRIQFSSVMWSLIGLAHARTGPIPKSNLITQSGCHVGNKEKKKNRKGKDEMGGVKEGVHMIKTYMKFQVNYMDFHECNLYLFTMDIVVKEASNIYWSRKLVFNSIKVHPL